MENLTAGGEGRDGHISRAGLRGPGADGHFFTEVNGAIVKFKNSTPKGKRILEKAEYTPTVDYVLIQLKRHKSESVGLDETVDLAVEGTEEFRAFKSDRVFRFIFNGHGFDWGAATVTEPELRALGHVPDDQVIMLKRDSHEVELKHTDVLDLAVPGTEHIRTEKKLVTVYFENQHHELQRGVYTTEELKRLFGVKDGYFLEVINEEGNLTPLKPADKTRVKEGLQFFEQVPCGGSS